MMETEKFNEDSVAEIAVISEPAITETGDEIAVKTEQKAVKEPVNIEPTATPDDDDIKKGKALADGLNDVFETITHKGLNEDQLSVWEEIGSQMLMRFKLHFPWWAYTGVMVGIATLPFIPPLWRGYKAYKGEDKQEEGGKDADNGNNSWN